MYEIDVETVNSVKKHINLMSAVYENLNYTLTQTTHEQQLASKLKSEYKEKKAKTDPTNVELNSDEVEAIMVSVVQHRSE